MSVKSQEILFSGLYFISLLQYFEMHFLSEKVRSMLQSDQFDTLRLTHVVVVVSGFRSECFLPNSPVLFPAKSGKRLKMKREMLMACKKKVKVNVNIDCFSLIKGH